MTNRRFFYRGLVLTVAAAAALAVVPAGHVAAKGGKKPKGVTHHVNAAGGPIAIMWQWDPADLTIAAGDSVMWMNETAGTHRVVPYEGSWDEAMDLPSDGGMATFRFKEEGVYRYRCDVPSHSVLVGEECRGMCGTVTVEAAGHQH